MCRMKLRGVLLLALVASACGARDLSEISYRFTTCGMSGHRGPSLEQCAEFYRQNSSPIARDDVLIGFEDYDDINGAQGFRVPRAGLYNITIAAAAGGRGVCNFEIGHGLVQQIQVELSTIHELLVLVGQKGLGPCDTENPPSVCDTPPTLVNETAECNATWYESLISEGEDYGNFYYPFVGGGSGGGASVVWLRVNDEPFGDFPVAISGGGGGSPSVLLYEVIQDIVFTTSSSNITGDEMLYHDFLDANAMLFDTAISDLQAGRGFRNTAFDSFPSVNAGAGGGLFQSPNRPVTEIDGKLLGLVGSSFAQGGCDCATLLSAGGFFERPLQEVYGGFGGGGGGCGGGGGGGGYTGGAVVQRSVDLPGGGGYSAFNPATDDDIAVVHREFSQNIINDDGYVDIVLANCGCAYECDLDIQTEQFECLCRNDTQRAPDQSDCFQAAELDVEQGPSMLLSNLDNVEDLYVTPLSFNETATFIFSINLRVSTITQRGQGTCAVVFIGQDSEVILTSNLVMGSGTVNSLAIISVPEEKQTLLVSEYTDFLNSSILVTGAVLISSQPCSVEGMSIGVNSSIRETDTESLEHQEILEIATNITSETARTILMVMIPSENGSLVTVISVSVLVGGLVLVVILIVIIAVVRVLIVRRRAHDKQPIYESIESLHALETYYITLNDAYAPGPSASRSAAQQNMANIERQSSTASHYQEAAIAMRDSEDQTDSADEHEREASVSSNNQAGDDYEQAQCYEQAGDPYERVQDYEQQQASGAYDQVQSYERLHMHRQDQVQDYEQLQASGVYDQVQSYEQLQVSDRQDQVQDYEQLQASGAYDRVQSYMNSYHY